MLLHGLGDTSAPFLQLGKQLSLPGTCILSLQAPFPYVPLAPMKTETLTPVCKRVPLMDAPSYTWHPLSPSDFLTDAPLTTSLESIVTHTVPLLRSLLRYLTTSLGWTPERIHLFGWAQGGSVALELARDVGVHGLEAGNAARRRLGSVTSICGPLLSSPPLNESLAIPTPAFYLTRQPRDASAALLRRTFVPETTTICVREGGGMDMPRGKEEWGLVMRFWSGVLARKEDEGWMRSAGGGEGEVYEVVR